MERQGFISRLAGAVRSHRRSVVLNRVRGYAVAVEVMLETISAEIIYCRERARLAREKADTIGRGEE
jgi:hypothetical protein